MNHKSALHIVLVLLCWWGWSITSQAQRTMSDPYAAEWRTIDSLDKQGLYQSALQNVEDLLARARQADASAQVVKALIYRSKYVQELNEDGILVAIRRLENELDTLDFPERPIVASMLGELYYRYLQGYYRDIGDRTAADVTEDDLTRWTPADFVARSTELYLQSVSDTRTRDLPLNNFDAILNEGENTEGLWPTLYDFLANRAIEHFMTGRAFVSEPVYVFRLDQPAAFAPVREFVDVDFTTRDTSSMVYQALRVFQSLLRWRLAENNPAPLLDADLRRLRFVYDQSSLPDKEDRYRAALDQLLATYRGRPEAGRVLYALMEWHYRRGQRYQEDRPELQGEWREAVTLGERIIKEYPNSLAARQAAALLSNLREPSLLVQAESVIIPGQAGLVSLTYRNVEKVYLRVVQLQAEETLNRNNNEEDFIKDLVRRRSQQTWTVELPPVDDYRQHRTETKINALPPGVYALLMSDHGNFNVGRQTVRYLIFWVSRLGMMTSYETDGPTLLVVDRESGSPLPGVEVTFWSTDRRRPDRQNWRQVKTLRTDAQGFVTPDLPEQQYFRVQLQRGRDRLFPQEGISVYRNFYEPPTDRQETAFFLDRGLYRPGQTIYFKALLMSRDQNQKPGIQASQKVIITLHDANGQEVDRRELTSNDYGTVTGTFTAPGGRLLGTMSLRSSVGAGSQYFQVEEYKRPRFEVTFDTLSGQPRLGGPVTVSGKALAYAGPALQGVPVRYTVTRRVRFPWFTFYSRPYLPYPPFGETATIAVGEVTTGDDGGFTIEFTATPDPDIDRGRYPVFVYEINADVTDVTGETHSAQKSVSLGYTPIVVELQAPNTHERHDPLTIGVESRNLDQQITPVSGRLQVRRLDAPDRIFIERYWEKPDKYLLSRADYARFFPHYAYGNENETEQWPRRESYLDRELNTGTQDSVTLATDNWPAATYEISFQLRTEAGDTLTTRQYLTVYDEQTGEVAPGQILWKDVPQRPFEPGETATIPMATSEGETYVLAEIMREREELLQRWERAAPLTQLRYTFREEDRGNVGLLLTYVRFNRMFSEQHVLRVPWSNKQLSITYETFRDKLRPGQAEEWIVRLAGPAGDRIAAEMVASMYDASLDQLYPFEWNFSPYPQLSYVYRNWQGSLFHDQSSYVEIGDGRRRPEYPGIQYPTLNWFGFGPFYPRYMMRNQMADMAAPPAAPMAESLEAADGMAAKASPTSVDVREEAANGAATGGATPEAQEPISPRTNLQETAFFFPQLETDEQGRIVLRFDAPEALTRWKLQLFGHSKDLAYGLSQRSVVTQKELMILPNAPRFLREGDRLDFTAKVSNLSEQSLSGQARLEIFDAATGEALSTAYGLTTPEESFSLAPDASAAVSWTLQVPRGAAGALTYRVTARAGAFTDGEEAALPVLTNQILVTETKVLYVRSRKTTTATLDPLAKLAGSSTRQPKTLSLEVTSNPAWLAVKALPYLMEYPHDCVEQVVNRLYANTLATSVVDRYPRIKEVFAKWKANGKDLESPLAINEALKSAVLEETPWVQEAQDEAEQRQRIALLFDLNRMADERTTALNKLVDMQDAEGGFAWFPGGRSNWYMTQYVAEALAHLHALGAMNIQNESALRQLLTKALTYIDEEVQEAYRELAKRVEKGDAKFEDDHLSPIITHYLYVRSFFPEREWSAEMQSIWTYYLGQAEKYWLDRGLYEQGMLALALHRSDRGTTAQAILASLRERALRNDELGMYWKYPRGFYWHQLPLETHALMIEVFQTLGGNQDELDELRLWLLRNKETNRWETTKATAAAVYALLMTGSDWLGEQEPVQVSFPRAGKQDYENKLEKAQASAEAGTGYFQVTWSEEEIKPDLATVRLRNRGNTVAWGGLYWQYLEDIDKVERYDDNPLQIDRQLFLERSTEAGQRLEALSGVAQLQPGDKLTVRLTVRTDRDMEFVHLKDLRASGLEPVEQLSGYRYQDALGYYQSTTDVGTHFFFDYLPRGTHVLEYELWVTYRGDFSNGLSTLQCMYAPAYSSHSEGSRLQVGQ